MTGFFVGFVLGAWAGAIGLGIFVTGGRKPTARVLPFPRHPRRAA